MVYGFSNHFIIYWIKQANILILETSLREKRCIQIQNKNIVNLNNTFKYYYICMILFASLLLLYTKRSRRYDT